MDNHSAGYPHAKCHKVSLHIIDAFLIYAGNFANLTAVFLHFHNTEQNMTPLAIAEHILIDSDIGNYISHAFN